MVDAVEDDFQLLSHAERKRAAAKKGRTGSKKSGGEEQTTKILRGRFKGEGIIVWDDGSIWRGRDWDPDRLAFGGPDLEGMGTPFLDKHPLLSSEGVGACLE